MNKLMVMGFLLAINASPSVARAAEWTVDKSHSQITFTVSHMVISEVSGTFAAFDVQIEAENDDLTGGSLTAIIKTASINTGIDRRDNHLRSDDFFNAEKYPEITFKSTRIAKIGDGKYTIEGNLTIRDITKPVAFDAVLNGTIKTDKSLRSGWKATLAINRFDYGLHWNRTIETGGLVAGDTVHIAVNIEIIKPLNS